MPSDAAPPPLFATASRVETSTPGRRRLRSDQLLVRQSVIEENERRRIGQAIHDVVLQDLAAVRNAIRLSTANTLDSEKGVMVAQIDKVIVSLRTLLFELSPPILQDLGLFAAIRWLADHLHERHGVVVALDLDDGEPELSNVSRTILFRCTRELTHNAVKHAPGAAIHICGEVRGQVVRLIVSDNGPGFDWRPCLVEGDGTDHERHGYGLASVEQQVLGIGGTFDIQRMPEGGVRATMELPIGSEASLEVDVKRDAGGDGGGE